MKYIVNKNDNEITQIFLKIFTGTKKNIPKNG